MVKWDSQTDRSLLILALKQLHGSIDYQLLSAEFREEMGEEISLNALRIRIHQLRKMSSKKNDSAAKKSSRKHVLKKEEPTD